MRYTTPIPIAALAAAALAFPAAASASSSPPYPVIPVPAGQVQYTVAETTFESNVTVPGVTPWGRVEETWASASAARNVLTDADSGQLLSECASTASSNSCFDADDNDLLLSGSSPVQDAAGYSWQTGGARIERLIALGELHLIGETDYLGRAADTYAGPAEGGQLTVIADAATHYPLQQRVTFADGAQTATQVSRVTAFETLSPASAAAELTAGAHLGSAASRAKRAARRTHGKRRQHSARRR
jgi:hypothetical protein